MKISREYILNGTNISDLKLLIEALEPLKYKNYHAYIVNQLPEIILCTIDNLEGDIDENIKLLLIEKVSSDIYSEIRLKHNRIISILAQDKTRYLGIKESTIPITKTISNDDLCSMYITIGTIDRGILQRGIFEVAKDFRMDEDEID